MRIHTGSGRVATPSCFAICCHLVLTVTSADTRIRVALFHPCLIAGGIQRVFVNLARGFVERGLAVDLVQATPDGEFRHAVPEGVRLIDLNAGRRSPVCFHSWVISGVSVHTS